jgi:uncharacterized DUF497 family protein
MLKFEWNEEKAKFNKKKHGILFQEAATIFSDPRSLTFPDPEHSVGEERYITIGMSHYRNLLIVSHLDFNETIRIISARLATKQERKYYEEKKRK